MRPPLDGGLVLITGASSGIGGELARQLAGRARGLVLVARRQDRLEALRAELLARQPSLLVSVQACDLVDRAATDAMLERVAREVGEVDVLVNNAGYGDYGPFAEADWDRHEGMITLNVTALAYLTRRLLPPMLARGRGGVLNVSSGFGLQFMPSFATYVGTKHFVTGFTESLRLEARRYGVVVSQVCPGPIDTEFHELAKEKQMPGWLLMPVDRCVRSTLRAFGRGRALIVPGFMLNALLLLGALTPRPLLRWVNGRAARLLE
jgi:short-subunit dehydrogenase